MDWLDKLTPEERRRFEHQRCIGCGEPGHIRRECPNKMAVDYSGNKTTYPRLPTKPGYNAPLSNQKSNIPQGNRNQPKYTMGG